MPTTRKDSMTATTNPAAAFRDKLLDRLPIYTATGREIAALTVPDSRGEDALALVNLAVRRWLVDAVEEADDEALSAVLGSLRDLPPLINEEVPARAAVSARDAVRLAGGLATPGRVVDVGKLAARAADAGAERDWIDAAELAADALYAGIERGPEYVASEARPAIAAMPSSAARE